MAYFITLDNPDPGFDAFVNGKAIAREAEDISKLATSLGLKTPDDYFSISGDDAGAMAEEFGVDDDIQPAPEQWFDPDEGLEWVRQLRAHLQQNPTALKDTTAVLADLAEYETILSQAKFISAKWHFSVDY